MIRLLSRKLLATGSFGNRRNKPAPGTSGVRLDGSYSGAYHGNWLNRWIRANPLHKTQKSLVFVNNVYKVLCTFMFAISRNGLASERCKMTGVYDGTVKNLTGT